MYLIFLMLSGFTRTFFLSFLQKETASVTSCLFSWMTLPLHNMVYFKRKEFVNNKFFLPELNPLRRESNENCGVAEVQVYLMCLSVNF